jgi:phage terminase large subunit-like protein
LPDADPLLASLSTLGPTELANLRTRVETERRKRESRRQFWTYYPDTGPLRRELYAKHLEFFRLTATCNEVGMLGSNRSGKTTAAAYAVTAFCTGRYPPWWEGFRFSAPNEWWACGIDAKAVRDTIQQKLLGKFGEWGSGMIPHEDIIGKPTAGGVPESVDTIRIKHYDAKGKHDGISVLGFKNYEQDRESFQGTQKSIWCDEEAPMAIYTEALTRTLSTKPGEPNGLMLCTFTPLLGITEVVRSFIPSLRPSA